MTDPLVQAMSGIQGIGFAVFLIAFALVWLFLPLAVFGIKGKLDEVIAQLRYANKRLERIAVSTNQNESADD